MLMTVTVIVYILLILTNKDMCLAIDPQVSRKHLLEHVVPTLVSLKACLERAHSPLLKDVMEYFQVSRAADTMILSKARDTMLR